MIRANINDSVRIRLTPYGRQIHRAHWEEVAKLAPAYGALGYTPMEEDDAGYSKWQIWHLMFVFGKYMGPNAPLCFDTEFFVIPEE
jgi:hypothetical protein